MYGANFGGAEKFFERFSVAAHKSKIFKLKVFIKRNERRFNIIKKEGVEVFQTSFLGINHFWFRKKLISICKDFKPNILFSWMNRASNFLPEKRLNNEIKVGRLGGFYKLKNYINCDYLVANTPEIKEYIIESGWDKNKVIYLSNFVDEPRKQKNETLENLKKKKKKIILGIGRFHKNKGFDFLIKALSYLKNYHLCLVGNGILKTEYLDRAKKLEVENRLHIFDWCDSVSEFYNSADILVCSSIIEPLGNIIIEGWAHKIPVVSANVMGPKFLIRNKYNGLKYESEDLSGYINSIKLISEDKILKRKLIHNGYMKYKYFFSKNKVLNQYQSFFKKIIK